MNNTNRSLTILESPIARCDCLKFKVGRTVTRPMESPVWGGIGHRKIVGMRSGPEQVDVFEVLGFGSTLKAAQSMAERTSTQRRTRAIHELMG